MLRLSDRIRPAITNYISSLRSKFNKYRWTRLAVSLRSTTLRRSNPDESQEVGFLGGTEIKKTA